MEPALSARSLAFAALALAPGLTLAKPVGAGPDRTAIQALVKQCEGKEDFSAPAPPAQLYGNTWYVGTCTVSGCPSAPVTRTQGSRSGSASSQYSCW